MGSRMRLVITLDQIVYSGTSFLVGIAAARALSVDDFGRFSLVFATAVLFLGLQRAMSAEPLLIVVGTGIISVRVATRALGRSLTVGLVSASAVTAALYISGESLLTSALVGGATIFPFLQDIARFTCLAGGSPRWMLLVDIASSASQLLATTTIAVLGADHYPPFILAWAIGSLVGPLLALWPIVRRLSPTPGVHTGFNRMSLSFGLDYLLGVGAAQGTLYAATLISGYGATAALRGAETIIGPFRIVLQTLPALLLRRWSGPMHRRRSTMALAIAGTLALPLMAAAAVSLLIPPDIGSAILGESWTVAAPVLPVAILGLIPVSLTFTCTLGLKSMGLASPLVKARLSAFPVVLGLGLGGAILGGSYPAAVGVALGSTIASLIFLAVLMREERSRA